MLPGRVHGVSPAIDRSRSWRSHFHNGLQPMAQGTGTNDRTTDTAAPSAMGGIICRECGIGILPMNTGGTPVPQRYDRLGNVVGVTYANGNAMALYTMDAFGNVLEMTNGGDFANERSTDVQPYHLTTKEYDTDSDLYYFNARWYDPETGGFVSRDPITRWPVPTCEVGEAKAYQYASSNPLRYVDATGHDPTLPDAPPDDWSEACSTFADKLLERGHDTQCVNRCRKHCACPGDDWRKAVHSVAHMMSQCYAGCLKDKDCVDEIIMFYKCVATLITSKGFTKPQAWAQCILQMGDVYKRCF